MASSLRWMARRLTTSSFWRDHRSDWPHLGPSDSASQWRCRTGEDSAGSGWLPRTSAVTSPTWRAILKAYAISRGAARIKLERREWIGTGARTSTVRSTALPLPRIIPLFTLRVTSLSWITSVRSVWLLWMVLTLRTLSGSGSRRWSWTLLTVLCTRSSSMFRMPARLCGLAVLTTWLRTTLEEWLRPYFSSIS